MVMPWHEYLPILLEGLWITLQLTLYSTVLGAALAFAAGIGRLSKQRWLRWLSASYIELFRGTSLLVQLFWLFFALPMAGQALGLDWRLSPLLAGVLTLGLNIGAYGAEVVRGALQSVAREQLEAAKALNFTSAQTLRHIMLPQAVAEMMPAFGNLVVQNLKDTALVSLITLADLTFKAEQLRNFTQDSVVIYSLVLGMYFAVALVLTALMRVLERVLVRWRVAGR